MGLSVKSVWICQRGQHDLETLQSASERAFAAYSLNGPQQKCLISPYLFSGNCINTWNKTCSNEVNFHALLVIIHPKINISSVTSCSDVQSNHEGQTDNSSAVWFSRCSGHRAEGSPEDERAACQQFSLQAVVRR